MCDQLRLGYLWGYHVPLGSIINELFPRWFHLFVTYIAKGKISLCFHYVVRILVYLARLPRKADIKQEYLVTWSVMLIFVLLSLNHTSIQIVRYYLIQYEFVAGTIHTIGVYDDYKFSRHATCGLWAKELMTTLRCKYLPKQPLFLSIFGPRFATAASSQFLS